MNQIQPKLTVTGSQLGLAEHGPDGQRWWCASGDNSEKSGLVGQRGEEEGAPL